jgi:coenzyme F420-reducing hydrogenase alpha subunit
MSGVREGDIRVTAFLAGGTVRRVAIAADRPVSLASAMIGRPVAVVAEAVAALHGLCGQSHAASVHFAAAAARGESLPPEETGRWMIRLAAERLAEHVRHLITSPDADGPWAYEPAVLRGAFAAGQAAARSGTVRPEALSRLLVMVGEGRPSTPCGAGGPSPAMTTRATPADVLSPSDDAAVIAALAADPGFIRAPHLPGRVPETGPAARHGISAADPDAAADARIAEIRDAAALLLDPAAAAPVGWITAGPAGPAAGYAAAETPRGRLYYRLALDGAGNLRDARVLAPTEWNFHPAGPMVRALTGFRPGSNPVAAITRRAAAFDPCVALRVSVESAADA